MTLIHFYKAMASEMSVDEKVVLNHLMRGLSERGWLPSVSDLMTGLEARGESTEAARGALDALITRRLITLDESESAIACILGAITAKRTAHRGHLEGGVNVFTHGGFELLCLHTIFVRPIDGATTCPQCEAKITFRMSDGAISALSPNGAAAFQANWDGTSGLRELSEHSPLFCSNACMSTWSDARPELDGLPVSSDLLLHVGVMVAGESGASRFAMFGLDG